MNNYFTLRRANRLRVKLLNSKSQEQIREVIRYLRRTSWDECGVELIYSDLIDMAVQANENGQELFNVIEDAKTFAEEVKPSLKTLRTGDYFWFVAPLYFFFGWGIESLLLYPRTRGHQCALRSPRSSLLRHRSAEHHSSADGF